MARAGNFEYDVALSFAGDDREYVQAVADGLVAEGVRVFYDDFEKAELWGKDLYGHLDWVYQKAARYCLLFASDAYANKVWTTHERRSAQARAVEENEEYILPVRFDSTSIPGLRPTVVYVNADSTPPEELVTLTKEKLGPSQTENFFPPSPDLLLSYLDAEDEDASAVVYWRAKKFFNVLQRMTPEERAVVYAVLCGGCHHDMPDNIHMSLDLVRRETGLPESQILELLTNVHALGFRIELRDSEAEPEPHELVPAEDKMVYLEWHNLVSGPASGNATGEAVAMTYVARSGYCEEHGQEALAMLNFANLASSTLREDQH